MGCFCTCPNDFTGGVFLYLCQTDPTGWAFLYLSHTDSTGEAFLYLSHIDLTSGVFLYLFVVSVPGLGGGVGSWRHHGLSVCSLCLCQALVVVWGPGVITGSLCVVSVPGLGGGVGSRRHHGFPVCSLCLCQALVVVWGPGVITGSLCALVLLCLRQLPETRGKALPMEIEDIEAWYTDEEEKKKRSKDLHQAAA